MRHLDYSMLGEWLKTFTSSKIVLIVKGNYYRFTGKNKQLYLKRYLICKDCPFNSKNKKDLNLIQKLWALFGQFCTDCGCPLKSKLTEPLSECPQLHWGQELKTK